MPLGKRLNSAVYCLLSTESKRPREIKKKKSKKKLADGPKRALEKMKENLPSICFFLFLIKLVRAIVLLLAIVK